MSSSSSSLRLCWYKRYQCKAICQLVLFWAGGCIFVEHVLCHAVITGWKRRHFQHDERRRRPGEGGPRREGALYLRDGQQATGESSQHQRNDGDTKNEIEVKRRRRSSRFGEHVLGLAFVGEQHLPKSRIIGIGDAHHLVCASKGFWLPRRFGFGANHGDDLKALHSRQRQRQQQSLSPFISQIPCPPQGQVQWAAWELMRALLFDGLRVL